MAVVEPGSTVNDPDPKLVNGSAWRLVTEKNEANDTAATERNKRFMSEH